MGMRQYITVALQYVLVYCNRPLLGFLMPRVPFSNSVFSAPETMFFKVKTLNF